MLPAPFWLRDLAGAWTFYTVLPSAEWLKPRFERIARFAPWIGLFIGCIQSGIWVLLNNSSWPKISSALIIISLEAIITGGLHLDGLIDTADGLAAGKKRRTKAMKDSNAGAIGVISLLIVVLIQLSCLIRLGPLVALTFPIIGFWSRFSPLWAIKKFNYINESGNSSFHQKHFQGLGDLIPAIIGLFSLIIVLALISHGWSYKANLIGITLIGIIPAIALPEILGRKLSGHNGDSYGASVVLVQTVMLLLLATLL